MNGLRTIERRPRSHAAELPQQLRGGSAIYRQLARELGALAIHHGDRRIQDLAERTAALEHDLGHLAREVAEVGS